MRVWQRRALVLLLVVALVGIFFSWGVSELGYWLVVTDPLEAARAVVVLGGHLPFRAMEAALIYRQGWAPEIWLTRPRWSPEQEVLVRLGVEIPREEVYNQKVLERLGVRSGAIRLLDGEVQDTVQELHLIDRELKRVSGDRVILVTSKAHTRRVRAIWRTLNGNSHTAIARYASEDPFDPARWWRRTRDGLTVWREVFGLINVWAGFPVQPDRP